MMLGKILGAGLATAAAAFLYRRSVNDRLFRLHRESFEQRAAAILEPLGDRPCPEDVTLLLNAQAALTSTVNGRPDRKQVDLARALTQGLDRVA